MFIEQLIAFNLALFVAMVSPGPALLIAIRTAINNGRMAGVFVGIGLAFAASTWTLMALIGLDSVFLIFPWSYKVIKTVGAIYLLYIAWTTWRNSNSSVSDTVSPNRKAFWQGVFVNLSNPKAVLFAAAVLVVIFPPNMASIDKALIVTNHLIIEIIFYGTVAFLMSTEGVRRRYLGAKSKLDKTTAIVLGGLGVRLLYQQHE